MTTRRLLLLCLAQSVPQTKAFWTRPAVLAVPSRPFVHKTQATVRSTSAAATTSLGTEFWGSPRTEEEIADFVAEAIFGADAEGNGGRNKVQVLVSEPPLVLIHDFLPQDMCIDIVDAAVETGGLRRSTMGAEQDVSEDRTSSNAWLREEHAEAPLRTFADRASRLTGVLPDHMENLQVVHYSPGQKFDVHADHLDSFNDLEIRGRLATILLYLNSASPTSQPAAESSDLTGGETWFPEFDVTVAPRRGSALFWWNTVERPGSDGYDPEMFLNCDVRMRHAGLPVLSGEKWACNRWIHPVPTGSEVRGYEESVRRAAI